MCPNDTVTQPFMCSDTNVHGLRWEVKLYSGATHEVSYIASLLLENGPYNHMNRSGIFFTELVIFDKSDEYTANITTSLRLNASIVKRLTCSTLLYNDEFHSFSRIFPAG